MWLGQTHTLKTEGLSQYLHDGLTVFIFCGAQ